MVAACPYPVPQGSQALIRDTSLALVARGHDVHLVTYGYGQGEDSSGLPLHRSPRFPLVRKTAAGPSLAKPLLDLALVVTLRRVCRKHRIDIVHAHNYEGLFTALIARARPVVYHAHSALSDELPYYFRGAEWAASLGRWLDRTLPRRADAAIALHHVLADYLVASGCRAERVSVVAPGAPTETLEPFHLTHELPAVLYAGNLDEYQNLDLLTEVMARVRAVRPETQFRIASHSMGRAVAGAEVTTVRDFESLRALLAEEAIVAVPRVSWSGFPIKLVNALAAGQAIVACESAAHPLENEVNGLVVADNDAEAFAEAILRLLAKPGLRRSLGQAARRTALELHAPDVMASRLEEVYERVLAGAPPDLD
jgi:glycosyltransferase involved in cell wall biosynthesis